MSLEYEPSSEPLHSSVNQLSFHHGHSIMAQHPLGGVRGFGCLKFDGYVTTYDPELDLLRQVDFRWKGRTPSCGEWVALLDG